MYQAYLAELLGRVYKGSFTATDNAPETYAGLKSIGHMYVYAGASDQSIYGSSVSNHLFRAYHDSVHLSHNLTFSSKDEYQVGLIQANDFTRYSSFAADMIYADVIGQVDYMSIHGCFPVNQIDFIEYYVKTKDLTKVF